jgi:hypothetical protein
VDTSSTLIEDPGVSYPEAKDQALSVLKRIASKGEVITYSELARQITVVDVPPNSDVLALMLDEISRAEDQAGRGMLSAVVIHKNDDYLPGEGFFKLAAVLGRAASDKVAFHAEELKRVHSRNGWH